MLFFRSSFIKIVVGFLFSKNHFKGAVHFLFSKNYFQSVVHFLFSKNHFIRSIIFVGLLFVSFSLCISAVAKDSLNESVRTLLLVTSPHQQSEIEKLEISSCSASCVSFKTFSQGAEFQLVIDTSKSEPELSFTRDSRTLSLPSVSYLEELINSARLSHSSHVNHSSHVIHSSALPSDSTRVSSSSRISDSSPSNSDSFSIPSSTNNTRTLVHRWLVGHELHPYSASEFSLKPSQATALEASREALKEHRSEQGETSSLLNIAPTGSGKTLVLTQTLMEQIETSSENKKLFIVTADRVHLVDQLHSQIQKEHKEKRTINVVNWGTLNNKSWQGLAQLSQMAQEGEGTTVLVITSQSLKLRLSEFFTQTERRYKNLQESFVRSVGGIYIDEAHHLGAKETRKVILDLVARSKAFLYGATATPVHHEVNLRDFFKREHWTYLNTRDHLFERHGTDAVLEQLSIGIERGELTPFDELYVIGEQTFKDLEEERKNNNNNDRTNSSNSNNNTSSRTNDNKTNNSNNSTTTSTSNTSNNHDNSDTQKVDLSSVSISVFMQAESAYYVLNPAYYESLLRIISPILSANRKGFIVTATIAEAKRLTEFLNNSVSGIEFDVLHSQMEEQERREVLSRSVHSTGSHYIVSVRMLDEGINLPHLSAYIDLNFNVSIKQMIHRIGRVLRLYPNKLTSDVLFLIDYRDEEKARDALSILDQIKNISFRGGEIRNKETRRRGSGDSHLLYEGTGIRPMSRADLEEMREKLSDSILKRKFWQERYTLEQIPAAVARINASLPAEEKIRDKRTYKKYLKREDRDQRLPLLATVGYWYQKKHGHKRGLMDFIMGRESRSMSERLKEIPGLVSRINASLPEEEKIKDGPTYKKYLKREDRDPRLPPLTTVKNWYKQIHGTHRGLMNFILSESNLPTSYTLEQIPGAVARINEGLSEQEKIKNRKTYKNYLERENKDPRLPSFDAVSEWYKKKHGHTRGLMNFILSESNLPTSYTLEQIPGAVARINESLPEKEKIRNTPTYEEYLKREDRDKRLPPLATVVFRYTEKHGHRRGVMNFILSESNLPTNYTLEQIPEAVARINESLPVKEQISSVRAYEKYLKREDRDRRLPPLTTVGNWYKQIHGHTRGVMNFILSESNLPTSYTLEEIPSAVARINESLLEEEKIRDIPTYKEYLKREDRDRRLPPFTTVGSWYKQIHGHTRGVMNFIRSGSCQKGFSSSP